MRRFSDKSMTVRLLAILLCLLVTSGCGMAGSPASPEASSSGQSVQEAAGSEEEPELVEPVGNAVGYVTAEFRDISKVVSYGGVVCPKTEEYAYESVRTFGNYAALPGEPVQKGDVLFYGAPGAAGDEIESIEEENESLLEEFTAYSADMSFDIAKARKEEFLAAEAFLEICNNAPAEDSPWYDGWARGAMPAEKKAKQTRIAREKLEQALKERQEQFDLQYAYNEKRIERLQTEISSAGEKAASDGIVVASAYHLPGDSIPEGTHILAVGDPGDKVILCEYVSKSVINTSAEIYALIEGERYEVQYEVMESDEYRRIKQRDGDVYTTFHLADPDNKVSFGQAAVIVIVQQQRNNLLCVPKGAVGKDERGSFVFVYKDGESVYTPVQTGVFDAFFFEITSGLHEGDAVVYDVPYTIGSKTVKLEKGEVSTRFSMDGFLFYPSAEWLVNPAKIGTCYMDEILVKRYELVEKGQALARIEILTDDVEIARLRRKIDRQNARLSDLEKRRSITYNKDELESIDRAVRDRNRAIASLNRQLEKLTRYSGVYEIKAPESGIITDISTHKTGELLDYQERLVQISRNDSCYIVVEDKEGKLSYGDTAKITIRDLKYKGDPIEGTVVTVSPRGLTREMRTGYVLVKVSQTDMNAMAEVMGSNVNDGYWTRSQFGIEVTAGHMGNVLLIPKKAVYLTDGETFVMTRNADGSIRLIKFIAGGSDPTNYWVAYGDVSEGMEIICSE